MRALPPYLFGLSISPTEFLKDQYTSRLQHGYNKKKGCAFFIRVRPISSTASPAPLALIAWALSSGGSARCYRIRFMDDTRGILGLHRCCWQAKPGQTSPLKQLTIRRETHPALLVVSGGLLRRQSARNPGKARTLIARVLVITQFATVLRGSFISKREVQEGYSATM